MNREKVLDEYFKTVAKNSLKARNLIKKLDYKEDHYLLRCIAQTYLDESLFEENGKMRLYIDKRKWRLAEHYIFKAFKLNPDCLDVLYTMGSVRRTNNQTDIAIYCYGRIIKMGVKGIGSGVGKIDREYALELINDSKFELYRLYYDKDPGLSKRYLSMYNSGLKKGIRTIYKPLRKFLLD